MQHAWACCMRESRSGDRVQSRTSLKAKVKSAKMYRYMALNLPQCDGMLDRSHAEMHAVHTWLMYAVAARSYSDRLFVANASFTERHPRRYGCYKALMAHADAHKRFTFLAVSFHISRFMPRFTSPPSPPNVRWVVFEPTYPRTAKQLVAPYVMLKPHVPSALTPWHARRLVLFAGHVPKPSLSHIRQKIAKTLHQEKDATVSVGADRLSAATFASALFLHRFCIVSPGDTRSTKKLAEAIVVGSYGGCVPLVHTSTTLPYVNHMNYSNALVYFHESTLASTLTRLRMVDNAKYVAWLHALREIRHVFEQPHAAHYLLHVAREDAARQRDAAGTRKIGYDTGHGVVVLHPRRAGPRSVLRWARVVPPSRSTP